MKSPEPTKMENYALEKTDKTWSHRPRPAWTENGGYGPKETIEFCTKKYVEVRGKEMPALISHVIGQMLSVPGHIPIPIKNQVRINFLGNGA